MNIKYVTIRYECLPTPYEYVQHLQQLETEDRYKLNYICFHMSVQWSTYADCL